MTPAFSARRRADDFEALVSRSDHTPLTERDARDFAALLAVVEDLRAVPEVTARPEFVGDLREQLMAAADTALVPASDPARDARAPTPLRSPRRQRRFSVLLGGAALVGATATVAVAAQTALPGESLYPVKRGIESAQLQLVSGPDRGRAQLANAADRLTELEALSAEDDDARMATLAADTLESFTDQADEGGELLLQAYAETDDRDLVEEVHDFNVSSMSRLGALEEALPTDTTDALSAAAEVLLDLDVRAANACPVCSGGLSQVSSTDDLGLDLGAVRPTRTLPGTTGVGQEIDGIVVPELVVPPVEEPTDGEAPTLPLPLSPTPSPTGTKTPGEVLAGTTGKVEETLKGTEETLKGTGETITDGTTGAVEELTNGVTGSVGGVGEVTEGTINDVTRWLDYLNGGGQPSGGGLTEEVLPDTSLPDSPLP